MFGIAGTAHWGSTKILRELGNVKIALRAKLLMLTALLLRLHALCVTLGMGCAHFTAIYLLFIVGVPVYMKRR